MAKLHIFGHMDLNKVRKGDRVKAYETVLATVGDGNGQYKGAHLHHGIATGLTPDQMIAYVGGWSKTKVQQYYEDPSKTTDYKKIFGIVMDIGRLGFRWLEWIGNGYHPGVDVNNPKGGNSDFGMPFKSPVDGEVVYEWRGWTSNRGWGNIIIVEELQPEEEATNYDSNFKKILSAIGGFFGKDYGDKPSNEETDEIVEGLKNAK